MPTISPRSNRVEAYGIVTISHSEPWTSEQLAARCKELMYMPVVSDRLYRENAGREALDVTVVGMSWSEAIDILAENPRRFVDWSKDEFQAEREADDGSIEVINPGLQTVLKRFMLAGFERGIIVGSRIDAENDVLSVTSRPNVTKLPKWALKLVERGHEFGSALPQETIEVELENTDEVEAA